MIPVFLYAQLVSAKSNGHDVPYTLWGDDGVAAWWGVIASTFLSALTLMFVLMQYRFQKHAEEVRRFETFFKQILDADSQYMANLLIPRSHEFETSQPGSAAEVELLNDDWKNTNYTYAYPLFQVLEYFSHAVNHRWLTDQKFTRYFDDIIMEKMKAMKGDFSRLARDEKYFPELKALHAEISARRSR